MAKKDKDIFDKIMDWKIFGWLRPFLRQKNKEMLFVSVFRRTHHRSQLCDRRHLKSAFWSRQA